MRFDPVNLRVILSALERAGTTPETELADAIRTHLTEISAG